MSDDITTIHHWFGLTRSAYFVMPRIAMEAMPAHWQKMFIALMDEADALGLETPSYHVLRQEPDFTTTKRYDEDDKTSRVFEYTAWSEDPWANYRRGDIKELCPSFRALPDGGVDAASAGTPKATE